VSDASQVYEKLVKIYECKNLKEFSLKVGKGPNWASQMRKNNSIPTDLCIETCEKYNLSLDWLIMGKDKKDSGQAVTKKELITDVKEFFYECWDLDLLPEYPKESISAISILFINSFKDKINISDEKENTKSKRKVI